MIYSTLVPSPIGRLTLATDTDGKALIGLWIEGQKYHGGNPSLSITEGDDLPIFSAAIQWLKRYFTGENPSAAELPLAPVGSEFRQRVWSVLRSIPYGEIVTYGGIAKQIAAVTGQSTSARAIGGAVGHNPISIIIPCHRVVGANGSLTGFAAGIETKLKLLELENADITRRSASK